MAGMRFSIFSLMLLSYTACVNSYSHGPPGDACFTLRPSHRGSSPQDPPSPYVVEQPFAPNGYSANTDYQITIRPLNSSIPIFKGLLCMGRDAKTSITASSTQAYGLFQTIPTDVMKFLPQNPCGGTQIGVSHRHAVQNPITGPITVTWRSPPITTTEVEVRCTIVQSELIFWQQVKPIVVTPTTLPPSTTDENTTTGEVVTMPTTTPPTTQPATTVPSQDLLAISTSQCGESKACYRKPAGCSGSDTCDFLFTQRLVTPSSDPADAIIEVELAARVSNGMGWVAVGYSTDDRMGDDDVFGCEVGSSGLVYVKNLWNPGRFNVIDNSQDGAQYLTVLGSTQNNGRISCKFQRALRTAGVTASEQRDLDLSQPYTLFFGTRSAGTASANSGLSGRHETNPVASTQTVSASSTAELNASARDRKKLQAHGALMIIAWIGASVIGLFLARFMRKAWDKPYWFLFHRGIMVFVVVVSVIGIILIFVDVEGYSDEHKTHAALGLVTVSLAFIQPFMAFFRPAPDAGSRRTVFNWAHRIVGVAAQVLGIISVNFGLDAYKKVGFDIDDKGMIVWALWLGLLGVIWVLLEIYTSVGLSSEEKGKDIPMKDVGDQEKQKAAPEKKESRDHNLRRSVFVLFAIISVVLCLALVIIVGSAEQ